MQPLLRARSVAAKPAGVGYENRLHACLIPFGYVYRRLSLSARRGVLTVGGCSKQGRLWHTGSDDLGTPHPDTTSPIRKGRSLLEGARLARERELGDGTPQHWVVAQLEAALHNEDTP